MKKNNFDIEIFKELGIDINLQEIEFTKEIKTISKNEEVDQLTSKKYLEFQNKNNKELCIKFQMHKKQMKIKTQKNFR